MTDVFPAPPWLERANRLAIIARLISSNVDDVNNALQVIDPNPEPLASGHLNEFVEFVRDGREQAERVGLKAMAAQGLALRHSSITKLRVTPTIEGDEAFADACPRHVLQIVINLVMIAERACRESSDAKLRLAVKREDDRVSLTVEDSGRGLPAGAVTRMCEPEAVFSGAVDDLEIGLSVSRWLAGRSGGTLTCGHSPAGSSQLTLVLPASAGDYGKMPSSV